MIYSMSHKSSYKWCTNVYDYTLHTNAYFIHTNDITSCCWSQKMHMKLLWLIPICRERHRVPSVGLLVIAASTHVNVFSSIAVFGLPDFLASATETVILNFLSFATLSCVIWLLCFCIEGTQYMTRCTFPSQQNNVNTFFLF